MQKISSLIQAGYSTNQLNIYLFRRCLTDKSSIPLDERTYFRRAETPECDSRITPYNTPERGSSVDIRTISEIFKRMTPKHLHGKKKFNFLFHIFQSESKGIQRNPIRIQKKYWKHILDMNSPT